MNMRDNADVRRLLRDLHDRLSGIGPECAEVRALLAAPSPGTGAPTHIDLTCQHGGALEWECRWPGHPENAHLRGHPAWTGTKQADAALAVEPVPTRFAWLIERDAKPAYLGTYDRMREFTWVDDHAKAMAFATKEQADGAMMGGFESWRRVFSKMESTAARSSTAGWETMLQRQPRPSR